MTPPKIKNERDKQIWLLAMKATNALSYATQNSHNDRALIKYEKQSMNAMDELYALLSEPKL